MTKNFNYSKALPWFEKGNKEIDCFSSFIYYWIAFNALYSIYSACQIRNAKIGGERKQICELISTECDSSFESVLSLSEVHTFEHSIKNLHPINSRHLDTHTEASALSNKRNPPIDRLSNLMLCIYQARCNLFHGEKVPSNYHDQEIASAASKILKEFLTIYFGGQQNGQTTLH